MSGWSYTACFHQAKAKDWSSSFFSLCKSAPGWKFHREFEINNCDSRPSRRLPDICVMNGWLLHKVSVWQFGKSLPCRRMLKISSIYEQLTDCRAQWAYHHETKALMPQRAIWCVSEYHKVLTLQREDADFIVLPSVTSVCVLGCLKASPTPSCLLPVFTTVEYHVRAWPAALSTPQSGEPVSHLIGKRLPWKELGDASLIYCTHTSQGNQRKGILLTPRITSSHASLSLFPFFLLAHTCLMHSQRYIKTHIAPILTPQWGIIHPCLAPGSPVVLYCFCSFDFFHTRL